MRGKITEWIVASIFAIVGLVMIVLGIFLTIETSEFRKTAIETTAEVISVGRDTDTDGDIHYNVYVSYNVGNEVYESSYSTSSYTREGSSITVYYDPENPTDMRTSTSNLFGIIMSVMGIVFSVIGLGLLFNKLNKNATKKKLLESGERINAELQEVTINYSYSVNNRHPFIIICQGRNINGELTVFQSENIWYNPENLIKERNITTFPVYIDPNNQKKYYVALEEVLPDLQV